MTNPTAPRDRTFVAKFKDVAEAEMFMLSLFNKCGKLAGSNYTCCRFGKSGPTSEGYTIFLEFVALAGAINPNQSADFEKLLSAAKATEVPA